MPKPRISLDFKGVDGNIFFIAAHAMAALKQVGQPKEAEELATRLFTEQPASYAEALAIIRSLVDVVDTSDLPPMEVPSKSMSVLDTNPLDSLGDVPVRCDNCGTKVAVKTTWIVSERGSERVVCEECSLEYDVRRK